MKLAEKTHKVDKNFSDGKRFTIAANNSIFETLSSRLYTNPKRAIIRELLSNAIDANIAAGVKMPVKLHLPSSLEPTFYIKDSGIGMSEEEVMNIYTQYGNSTKDENNECIGGLGLGSKTPFAYTSQFIVESAKNGVKNSFICFLDENRLPCITKTNYEKTEETGTKVEFAIQKEHIEDFIQEAIPVLTFSLQMPEIVNAKSTFFSHALCKDEKNFEAIRDFFSEKDRFIDDPATNMNSAIYSIFDKFSSNVILVMGGVPYEVELNQVAPNHIELFGIRKVVIHKDIGQIAIQASREKLNYTEQTIVDLRKSLVNLAIADLAENML